MKRHILLFGALLAALTLTGVIQAMPQTRSAVGAQTVAGEYLIKFRPGASQAHRKAAIDGVGGKSINRIDALNIDVVEFPALGHGNNRQAETHVLAALEHNPNIEYVQPNYIFSSNGDGTHPIYLPQISGSGIAASFTPNDTYLSSQYGLTKINAFRGWGYTQGSSDVVVAIVDSGIQLDHPEFAGKIVPGGYDFVGENYVYELEDSEPNDTNGHGTHVAGIVGAITNNGAGVAGICPNCKLLPVRVLDAYGSGDTRSVTRGILHAVEHGAKVINLSLGIAGDGSESYAPAMKDAVDYAWSKGVVVTCAAGNEGQRGNPIMYPAYYNNCIAVGATDKNDSLASYSEYGNWVDIVAPGTSIYSTYLNGRYATLSGTSMATPHTAGAAGLLASQGLTNQQIRARLERSADPISGTGTYWSNGRLNMERALSGQ